MTLTSMRHGGQFGKGIAIKLQRSITRTQTSKEIVSTEVDSFVAIGRVTAAREDDHGLVAVEGVGRDIRNGEWQFGIVPRELQVFDEVGECKGRKKQKRKEQAHG
mmetsp:Transcript_20466/g.38291  ORF Transcript_20466/g.38291 Transcript_20466/m.38291 type:complete len:105 (-) Transcript_20466:165-479(-)